MSSSDPVLERVMVDAVATLAVVVNPVTPAGFNVISVPIPPGYPLGTDATIVLPIPPVGDDTCVKMTV